MFHGTQFNCCVGRDSPQIDLVFDSQQGFRCRRDSHVRRKSQCREKSWFRFLLRGSRIVCQTRQQFPSRHTGARRAPARHLACGVPPVSSAVLYPDPQSSTSLLLARRSTFRSHHPVHPRPKRPLFPAIGMFYHRRKETSTRESNEAGIALASEQMDSGAIKQIPEFRAKKMDGTSDARSFVHSITLSIKFVGLSSPFCCHVIECGLS